MRRAVIVHAKRTPVGQKDGVLRGLDVSSLAAPVIRSLAADLEDVLDEVIVGNAVGPGGNIARLAALEAGLPFAVAGMTIDRQCSSGLEAIRTACHFIQGAAGDCYIAGGAESTSTSPFLERARFAPDFIGDPDMGTAAENVAEKYAVSRAAQDDFALLSYTRSWQAFRDGLYKEEIVPAGGVEVDECFMKERNMEKLLKRAKPIFVKETGTVTTANSCGIHDGAAAVVVMEEMLAVRLGLKPVLRFVDSEAAGIDPNYPAASPIAAIENLLERQRLTIEDIDVIEMNEAFAAKITACAQELSIPYEKLNIRGGALTTGHPYGASGAILAVRLFYEAQRSSTAKYVLAAVGSAGGIGLAVLFEVIR